jgi:TLC ATP/ADP transporter
MHVQVFGAALYVGFRSAKFALYKPAEEMVYKKLDERAQTEGKASVDVVAAQFGKTGSSLGTQALLLALPLVSMVGAMGMLSCAFMIVGTRWRSCITSLSGKMDEIEPVTAAQLAQDAAGWGTKKATDWGEITTCNGTATGEWGTMPDGSTRSSRQMWGSDDRSRPSGVRCGALDPVLA